MHLSQFIVSAYRGVLSCGIAMMQASLELRLCLNPFLLLLQRQEEQMIHVLLLEPVDRRIRVFQAHIYDVQT